jgi:hypothetical protein
MCQHADRSRLQSGGGSGCGCGPCPARCRCVHVAPCDGTVCRAMCVCGVGTVCRGVCVVWAPFAVACVWRGHRLPWRVWRGYRVPWRVRGVGTVCRGVCVCGLGTVCRGVCVVWAPFAVTCVWRGIVGVAHLLVVGAGGGWPVVHPGAQAPCQARWMVLRDGPPRVLPMGTLLFVFIAAAVDVSTASGTLQTTGGGVVDIVGANLGLTPTAITVSYSGGSTGFTPRCV